MRTAALAALAVALVAATAAAVAVRGPAAEPAGASSHREAPLIAEDPSADATDLYAFRSPDRPDTVTIIGNWIPGEDPAAGPNWYTFSPRARYLLNIDRTGDGKPEVTYRFRFRDEGPGRVPRQHGPGLQRHPHRGRARDRDRERARRRRRTTSGRARRRTTARSPPQASTTSPGGGKVFAGQRDDAFFGDIGAIFDLSRSATGPGTPAAARTSSPATPSTRSRSRSRSPQLDTPNHVDRRVDDDRAAQVSVRQTKQGPRPGRAGSRSRASATRS